MANSDFPIPTDAYVGFDASTMRQLLIDNIRRSDVFKDANFEGSNINSIATMIAYSNSLLMFYLNNCSSEANFTYASIYENVNRLSKILSYNPVGPQSPIVQITAKAAASLPLGTYLVPRHSYISKNGLFFTLTHDVLITKTTTGIQELVPFTNTTLVQGKYVAHPTYIFQGENFEIVTLGYNSSQTIIDHYSIKVFVREPGAKWEEWSKIDSIFTESSTSRRFELRYNEYQRYEIKFGNGINGKKPATGSEVAVYYIKSDGTRGEVEIGALDGAKFFTMQEPKFLEILGDVANDFSSSVTLAQASMISVFNAAPSTKFSEMETVDSLKANAVNTFKTQYRLITSSDFENAITTRFSNIVSSVKVVSNTEYTGSNGHLTYLKNMGLINANQDARVLSNNITYADSCGFNNIYIYAVPKFKDFLALSRPPYITTGQKSAILASLKENSVMTAELVFVDPVYTAFDIGYGTSKLNTFKIQIKKDTTTFVNSNILIDQVANKILSFFDTSVNTLGQLLDVANLTNSIIQIPGIKAVYVTDGTSTVNGLSFQYWDAVNDFVVNQTSQSLQLQKFQFPYFAAKTTLRDKIVVI